MSSRFTERLSGSRVLVWVAVGAALLSLSACSTKTQVTAKPGPVGNPAECPWLNPQLPLGRRVGMLLSKMTLADEIELVG